MSHTYRFLVVSASAIAIALLPGCALFGVPTEDNYPDDYEQALIDALDQSEIVVQHSAGIDAWERASNIPPYDAPVEITPRAGQEQIETLLVDMIDIANKNEQPLPSFEFSSSNLHFGLAASGDLTPEFAADGIDVALRDGWGHVSIFGGKDENTTSLRGGADTVDGAVELVSTPLPASIHDALTFTSLVVTEISDSAELTGNKTLVSADAIYAAAAIAPLIDATPAADGSATFDVTSAVTDDGAAQVQIRIEVRADGLNDADAEDRPEIARQLGYTDYCHDIENAAAQAITDANLVFQCVATHVDID